MRASGKDDAGGGYPQIDPAAGTDPPRAEQENGGEVNIHMYQDRTTNF